MPQLKIFHKRSVSDFINTRPGEIKLGENIQFVSGLEELSKNEAKFVIFGFPEDIGVRANYGKSGTSTAWNAFLKSFLNIQENQYLLANDMVLLGEIDCSAAMEKASKIELSDPNYYIKLGEIVETIDKAVSEVVKEVISAGKVPIIVGGGHNNAFGNIKGASEALETLINVINIDAHTDLRKLEHRHSGNGFSYAIQEKFLKKYAIFGLQQNYTPQYIFDEMDASEDISYKLFEDLFSAEKNAEFKQQVRFVSEEHFGLEVDCDSIAGFPSSAVSPSGFTLDEVRSFVKTAANEQNCIYLHLCEATATENFPTGKALTYLLTDFIKSKTHA